MNALVETLNGFLWGKLLVVMLIGVGLWFTIASRFVQFRYFGKMFRLIKLGGHDRDDQVSSFQALAVTIAGRVGAGNIAGVAVAITLGGPGAVFWMWVIALVGMATSFIECSLAQTYKITNDDGSFRGGPAFYIEHGIGNKWLATFYSGLLVISVGTALIALQSYTVASSFAETFDLDAASVGLALALLTGIIIFGGIKRIARVAEWLVPIMAVGYCLVGLYVVITHLDAVPSALYTIVSSALGFEQAIGGGIGVAILVGAQRGLFSNEAGLGHAPNVAAVAKVKHPAEQGIVQSLSVFIDTIVLCTVTALIIILSGVVGDEGQGGVALTQIALSSLVGDWSGIFVTFALALFAFTTILYLYYLGENGLAYIIRHNRTMIQIFRLAVVVQIMWGATRELTEIFGLADLAIALLALTNLTALILLSKAGLRVLEDYDTQLRNNIEQPKFDSKVVDELNASPDIWKPDEKIAGR